MEKALEDYKIGKHTVTELEDKNLFKLYIEGVDVIDKLLDMDDRVSLHIFLKKLENWQFYNSIYCFVG